MFLDTQTDAPNLLYGVRKEVMLNAAWECSDNVAGVRSNQGSSCFVNSLLQLLQPMRGFRLCLGGHQLYCRRRAGHCVLCALHADLVLQTNGDRISNSHFTRLVRSGCIGADFSGASQCDAHEFFVAVIRSFNQAECDRAAKVGGELDTATLAERVQLRPVLSDLVWGIVVRHRLYCRNCDRASDRLSYLDGLVLPLPYDESPRSLEDLLLAYCKPRSGRDAECPAGEGIPCSPSTARITQQDLFEKEPPVLILLLNRRRRDMYDHKKLHNDVAFPEVLSSLRSGDYHFAAAIRHQGDTPQSGHYLMNRWLGESRYAEINCLPPGERRIRWEDVQVQGKEVYILAYVRLALREGVGDGSVDTPYKRDRTATELFGGRMFDAAP